VIDEAHYFLNERSARSRSYESRVGSYLFATYRPSLVASVVHEGVTAHLVTQTTVEEERYFLTGLLQARGPRDLTAANALARIDNRKVGLLLEHDGEASWRIFTPATRATVQAHHGRKYADTRLPDEKAFLFRHADGATPTAHSVVEFCAAVGSVPTASLRHHLMAGDFSRWAADILGDARLAAAFRKLEQTTRVGAPPSREEVLAHLKDLYVI
jgi:hypothetical protein